MSRPATNAIFRPSGEIDMSVGLGIGGTDTRKLTEFSSRGRTEKKTESATAITRNAAIGINSQANRLPLLGFAAAATEEVACSLEASSISIRAYAMSRS